MEAFKGRLAPDGNRSGPVKGKAGFTARRMCRAVGKPELSEPIFLLEKGKIINQKLPRG